MPDTFPNDTSLHEQPDMEPLSDGCRILERILDSIYNEDRKEAEKGGKYIENSFAEWLRKHPEMEPWSDGYPVLERIFDSILDANREKLFDKPVDAEHPLRYEYFARLCLCLFHHWKKRLRTEADVAARQIVDDIKSQYKADNVFDHVTLAVATVRDEQKAYAVFCEIFGNIFQEIASSRGMFRVAGENPTDAHKKANLDDCLEFVRDRLIAISEEPASRVKNARLENYRGHGGFKKWLYKAVDRRICDYLKKNTLTRIPDDFPVPQPNEDVKRLLAVVKTLSEEDQQLVELHCFEGWTLEEIGHSLPKPKDKSVLSRRLAKIMDKIKKRWDTVDVM